MSASPRMLRAELPVHRMSTLKSLSFINQAHGSLPELLEHEGGAGRTDAGELARGADGGRSGFTRRARVAALREESFRRGGEEVELLYALRARMRFGVSQEPAAGPGAPLRLADHQRTQQRDFAQYLQANEPLGRGVRAGVEKVFAMRGGEILRGQLRRGEQVHGSLQLGTMGDGRHAALLRRGAFTMVSGGQQLAPPS